MRRSPLSDAFAHHIWATQRLIDVCLTLAPEQLATGVPGTYGSILETSRHLVGADAWYLSELDGEQVHRIAEDRMDLSELRAVLTVNASCWDRLISTSPDPDRMIEEVDDGYRKEAPVGIRLAQALHHGTDHRSQICTALTALGIDPPSIDVWDYGVESGRVTEVFPAAVDDRG
jgi:uncharacterized damage-inducible protein DinB